MSKPRLALAGLVLTLALVLAACCPVTAPPETAFLARLQPEGNGAALAQLPDGRQLTVTGFDAWPKGLVYVQGRLLPDGSVAASSVRPTSGTVVPAVSSTARP